MNALLVDIGNSRVKWRLVDAHRDLARAPGAAEPGGALAVDDVDRIGEPWRALPDRGIDLALISNVAHAHVQATVVRAVLASWPAAHVELVVPTSREGGLVNGYDEPARLGPDRWLALIGAHALLPRSSLLVCTFGTATTIDLVTVASPDRAAPALFTGGLILPGFDAMRRSLAVATARLQPVSAGRKSVAGTFGTDTVGCIDSGIAAAQWGAVERAVRDAGQLPGIAPLTCFFAGGAVVEATRFIERLETPHRIAADLVLQGLHALAQQRPPDGTRPARARPVERIN